MKRGLYTTLTCLVISATLFAQIDSVQPAKRDTLNIQDSIIINSVKTAQSISNTDSTSKTDVKHNSKVYTLNSAFDIPAIVIGAGWSIYAFTKIYSKGSSSPEDILTLKESDVPSFDKWAIKPYDEGLDRFSYIPFYAAIPLPLICTLADEDQRKDFFKVSLLYIEALSITGLFGTGATYFVDRYRPYAYSGETEFEKRIGENAKNSFYAGHVEIISVSTFFIAKVHKDYHPDSKSNWVFFTAASAATLGMSYLRLQGGMHFPSDILLGAATGTLAGILVPHFHKTKSEKKSLSVLPVKMKDGMGLSLIYKR